MRHLQYLLDTDHLISMIKNQYLIRDFLIEVGFDSCAVCRISLAELYFGAYKGNNTEVALKQIRFIENNFTTLEASPDDYGRIRADLEKIGTPLDSMDMLIASTAIANNLVLLSHNVKHFSTINNLNLEDWIGNPEPMIKWIGERNK